MPLAYFNFLANMPMARKRPCLLIYSRIVTPVCKSYLTMDRESLTVRAISELD